MILGIRHIELCVSDLESKCKYFEDIYGFNLIWKGGLLGGKSALLSQGGDKNPSQFI